MNKLHHATAIIHRPARIGLPTAIVQTAAARFLFHPVMAGVASPLPKLVIERDHSA